MNLIYRFIASSVYASPVCWSSVYMRRYSCQASKRLAFDLSLYLVADRKSVPNEEDFFSKIGQAVKGGVTCIQLRDHDQTYETSLRTALRLKKMLSDTSVSLMINNRLDVALEASAEGVYLERKDICYSEARRLLGPDRVIGMPVYTMSGVLEAEQRDVDYLSIKIFPSKKTNPGDIQVWGIKGLQEAREKSRHRFVAIGGIDLDNLESVCRFLHLGDCKDGIAMVGDLWRADDPSAMAMRIRTIIEKVKK